MGMFDTIIFDRPILVPQVRGRDPLGPDQCLRVHARRVPHRRLRVAHAEEIRIVCDEPPGRRKTPMAPTRLTRHYALLPGRLP